jgi:hypothetical protein
MSAPISRIPPFRRTGHEIARGSGVIGSDRSHDRKGVSHKSIKPRGHGTSHMRRQS